MLHNNVRAGQIILLIVESVAKAGKTDGRRLLLMLLLLMLLVLLVLLLPISAAKTNKSNILLLELYKTTARKYNAKQHPVSVVVYATQRQCLKLSVVVRRHVKI